MVAELVFVGTELLLGQIVNTNGAYLGQQLAALGIDHYFQVVVGDNPGRLADTLRQALSRADVVITSGGLGPTLDDVTREVAAELTGRPLAFDEAVWAGIARGRQLKENMKRQAMVPAGATVLPNANGTAPGLVIPADGGKALILLPGPPSELQPMFEQHVVPYLLARLGEAQTLVSRSLRFCEIGESAIADALQDLIAHQVDPTLATYAKPGDVELRISTKARSREEGLARIAPVEAEVRRRLGDYLYGVDDTTFEQAVGEAMAAVGWRVGIADAATAGLLAHRLAQPPGSQAWLGLGLALGDPAVAKAWGLPDLWEGEAGAQGLAEAMRRLGCTVGVGLSTLQVGPAGPSGIQEGWCLLAIARPDGTGSLQRLSARGRLADLRHRLSQGALAALRRSALAAQAQGNARVG